MGCCNEPSAALTQSGQNPALHVNYTKGMVLGVDDFTQEFTYLANRDQWGIRELIGYGTSSGLAVIIEYAGVDGPRVHVKRGTAVAPSGKLICVTDDQCALINQWLAKPENANVVNIAIGVGSPPLSPPVLSGKISLFVTICYKDCKTLPVPIPGDPCRSSDKLMEDSRIADDYILELRTKFLPQIEEEALREFVAWLKQHVTITNPASPLSAGDEEAWIQSLKTAIQPWLDAIKKNPTKSAIELYEKLKDFLSDGSPFIFLSVERGQFNQFLRTVFRF